VRVFISDSHCKLISFPRSFLSIRLRRPAHVNGLYSSATVTAGSVADGTGSKMDVDAEHLDDGGSSDDEDDAPFPEAYTSGPAAVPLNPELLRGRLPDPP